jgi:hypothetical protein
MFYSLGVVNREVLKFQTFLFFPTLGPFSAHDRVAVFLLCDPFEQDRFPRTDHRAEFEHGQIRGRCQMVDLAAFLPAPEQEQG